MMRQITYVMAALFFIAALPVAGQVTYDELEFELDSITRAYKAKGKNYAYIRSKRGSSGVNKNNRADSVATLTINEIVLVYTEMDKNDRRERGEANRERWENLIKTYPEYFDYSPTLINMCQCNFSGDSVAFKKQQGFYVYFEGDEPAVSEPPVEEAKPVVVAATVVKAAPKAEPKREEKAAEPKKEESKKAAEEPRKKEEEPVAEKKKKVKEPEAEEAPVVKAEEPVVEKKKKEKKVKEKDPTDDITMDLPAEAKVSAPKKTGYSKPKRSKDPKACRPACYENGDEDLDAFFRDNITLTKKQKKESQELDLLSPSPVKFRRVNQKSDCYWDKSRF
jgi:flagellar biosynthesis GTPase FlhF